MKADNHARCGVPDRVLPLEDASSPGPGHREVLKRGKVTTFNPTGHGRNDDAHGRKTENVARAV
jgi:hypothetical protein